MWSQARMRQVAIAALLTTLVVGVVLLSSTAIAAESLLIPKDRSQLILAPREMAEVLITNPAIADVHVHGATRISVMGTPPCV